MINFAWSLAFLLDRRQLELASEHAMRLWARKYVFRQTKRRSLTENEVLKAVVQGLPPLIMWGASFYVAQPAPPDLLPDAKATVTGAAVGGVEESSLESETSAEEPTLSSSVPSHTGDTVHLGLLTAGGAWMGLALMWNVAVAWNADDRRNEAARRDLLSPLFALQRVLLKQKGLDNVPDDQQMAHLRLTLHVVTAATVDHHCKIEQFVPYVGGDRDGQGRRFPVHCGVTGQAVRSGKVVGAVREAKEEKQYVDELVRHWSFPPTEAKKLRNDRWSYLAVPIFDGTDVNAVLYADSDQPDFFTDEVRELLVNASLGIAAFIREYYKRP